METPTASAGLFHPTHHRSPPPEEMLERIEFRAVLVPVMATLADLIQNITVWCAFISWCLAQTLKFARHLSGDRRIDFSYFVRTGGMPSAHSSLVCALATSVGIRTGFDSAVFAVTLVVAAVVMFDAQSFRKAAGHQARLLNQMVEEIFKEHHLSQQKLVELLGHTRTEVFAGMGLGVLVALILHAVWG